MLVSERSARGGRGIGVHPTPELSSRCCTFTQSQSLQRAYTPDFTLSTAYSEEVGSSLATRIFVESVSTLLCSVFSSRAEMCAENNRMSGRDELAGAGSRNESGRRERSSSLVGFRVYGLS